MSRSPLEFLKDGEPMIFEACAGDPIMYVSVGAVQPIGIVLHKSSKLPLIILVPGSTKAASFMLTLHPMKTGAITNTEDTNIWHCKCITLSHVAGKEELVSINKMYKSSLKHLPPPSLMVRKQLEKTG